MSISVPYICFDKKKGPWKDSGSDTTCCCHISPSLVPSKKTAKAVSCALSGFRVVGSSHVCVADLKSTMTTTLVIELYLKQRIWYEMFLPIFFQGKEVEIFIGFLRGGCPRGGGVPGEP